MIHSSKPPLSFEVGANHLHGVLRADVIRNDTLVQLVQHWGNPDDRDAVIAALDELAEIVTGVAREGELDAAVEQVEDVASMDTAQIEVGAHDMRRLAAEAAEVERITSRFLTRGASVIKHPSHKATREYLAANPMPAQQNRRVS